MPDLTTLSDIRQRIAKWRRITDVKESNENWIYAVNVDDVEMLLARIDELTGNNKALHERLDDCMEQLDLFGDEDRITDDGR